MFKLWCEWGYMKGKMGHKIGHFTAAIHNAKEKKKLVCVSYYDLRLTLQLWRNVRASALFFRQTGKA